MKKVIWAIIIILVIIAAGFSAWYFYFKKSPEGGACINNAKCEENLKCINKTCSSGKSGSSCAQKSDCATNYCVNAKCTEGKIGNNCAIHKDCQNGLLCQKNSCIQKPDYSQYFENVIISKMKPGTPPGPDNPLTATTTFAKTDGFEIDFKGVKSTTVGPYYFEFVNATTGETAISTKNLMDTNFAGRDIGSGTDLASLSSGEYDLNVYYQDKLVYSTSIIIK